MSQVFTTTNATASTTLNEIRRLRDMTVAELHARYADVFGEASRSRNKDFLWKRIAWRLQELAEGGLAERVREGARQRGSDADLRIVPLAEGRGMTIMEALAPTPHDPRVPRAGATLTREFGGINHEVKVLQDGFEYQGRRFRSLSAVAREITGTRWNGMAFFKMTGKQKEA